MATQTTDDSRADPPSHGSAWPDAVRYGAHSGLAKSCQRSPKRKKTTELDNGAEAARPFSPSSRLAPSIGEKSVAARCREEASRGLRFSAQNSGFFVSEWCGREESADPAIPY